ncbi:MAG TPA: response regulator [Candidatus Blautia excrementigallinarum]|nr:response regulator [Candidatus Blautia excrementigallinarum]
MLKTFLAEDEIVVRENIKKMVPWEQYGFELVGEASDGEMALPLIKKLKPDLLITDIKMPFMDGLTLCKVVKKELPDIKIVILSGYDDFNYAKEAIGIGVEDYLLKPITKNAFLERLCEIRSRYEYEKSQREYYEQFHREMQEYEQNSSRDFFEGLISGTMDMGEMYERADKLGLDIVAEAYNILIFTLESENAAAGQSETYSEWEARALEKIEGLFADHSYAMLFRNNVFSYGVLVKEQKDNPGKNTRDCVESIREILSDAPAGQPWFIAAGELVERLSNMKHSYNTAAQTYARRYLYDGHILYYRDLKEEELAKDDGRYLKKVDINAMDPAIIQKFLGSGLKEETGNFVRDYFHAIGKEPMTSMVFRSYVILNVRFSVLSFLNRMGYCASALEESDTEDALEQGGASMEAAMAYAENMLQKAIEIRDENSGNKNRDILENSIEYIKTHYMDENMSLNAVAQVANISANHFSALFSQNIGQTFIEYLTGIRMEHAKELLRCTGKRASEIALEVGYKDSHYFSYLFKKTQGMTPSDYRKAKEEG